MVSNVLVETDSQKNEIFMPKTLLKMYQRKPYVVQCNPDLVTSYLVTNPDLVTILQKTIFLVHKNILFSDNLVFSAPLIL